METPKTDALRNLLPDPYGAQEVIASHAGLERENRILRTYLEIALEYLPHVQLQWIKEARKVLSTPKQEILIGQCVEAGNDRDGQPRLIIYTSKEQLMKFGKNLVFADVQVSLFHDKGPIGVNAARLMGLDIPNDLP